ncbi:MAG: hypothetical protein HGA67_03635 [Candidatus Yonathbacteria bacterium]|nr:hypothetical protein [Candidatus Yonathbacteria bacterium]
MKEKITRFLRWAQVLVIVAGLSILVQEELFQFLFSLSDDDVNVWRVAALCSFFGVPFLRVLSFMGIRRMDLTKKEHIVVGFLADMFVIVIVAVSILCSIVSMFLGLYMMNVFTILIGAVGVFVCTLVIEPKLIVLVDSKRDQYFLRNKEKNPVSV